MITFRRIKANIRNEKLKKLLADGSLLLTSRYFFILINSMSVTLAILTKYTVYLIANMYHALNVQV